jgi:hypothetical protein
MAIRTTVVIACLFFSVFTMAMEKTSEEITPRNESRLTKSPLIGLPKAMRRSSDGEVEVVRATQKRDATSRYLSIRSLSGSNKKEQESRTLAREKIEQKIKRQELLASGEFAGKNLSNAILDYGDYSKALLIGTDFKYASLVGSDLSFANCTGAKFFGADLSQAYFGTANLSEADLTGATLFQAGFYGADLTRAFVMEGEDRIVIDAEYLKQNKAAYDNQTQFSPPNERTLCQDQSDM